MTQQDAELDDTSRQDSQENYPFEAFISYHRTSQDEKIAKELFRQLETYRVPAELVAKGIPKHVGRVFRDDAELSASPDINAAIQSSLRKSRYLIVICSPRAAASKWISREVEYFQSLGRGNRILCLLVEGEPETAFPKALLNEGNPEPLAADIRASSHRASLRLMREAALRLLAPMLGCGFDDLRRRDQERRVRRLRWTAGLTSAGAVTMLALAAYATYSQRQARVAMAEAQARLGALHVDEARGEMLADHAGRALVHLAAAGHLGVDGPAERLLVQYALDSFDHQIARFELGASALYVAISANQEVAVATAKRVSIFEVRTGNRVDLDVMADQTIKFSANGSRLLIVGAQQATVMERSTSGWKILATIQGAFYADIDPTGEHVVFTQVIGDHVLLLDLASGRKDVLVPAIVGDAPVARFALEGRVVVTATSSKPGCRVANRSADDCGASAWIFETTSHRRLARVPVDSGGIADLSPGGRWVAVGGVGGIALIDTKDNDIKHPPDNLPSTSFAFSRDGMQLADGRIDGKVLILDLRTNTVQTLVGHEGQVMRVRFSQDGNLLVTAGTDGTIRIWDAQSAEPLAVFEGHYTTVNDIQFFEDGNIVSAGSDGTLRIWRPGGPPHVAHVATRTRIEAAAVDGSRVAAVTERSTLAVLDPEDGGTTWTWAPQVSDADPRGGPIVVAFRPNHDELLVATYGGLEVRKASTGALLRTLFTDSSFGDVAPLAADKFAAVSDYEGLAVVDVEDGGEIARFAMDEKGVVGTLASSPDKLWLLAWRRKDGLKFLHFDPSAKAFVRDSSFTPAVSGDVFSAAIAHRDDVVAVGYDSGAFEVRKVRQAGRPLVVQAHRRAISALAFSPDDAFLATAGADGEIKIWDVATGLQLLRLTHDIPTVLRLEWSTAERLAAIDNRGTINTWEMKQYGGAPNALRDRVAADVPWVLEGEVVRPTLDHHRFPH